MARVCMFTWKKTVFGRTRSHSMRQGKRKYKINLLKKKVTFYDWTTMVVKISAKAYKKLKWFMI